MVSPLPGKYESPGLQSEATLSLFAILINGDPPSPSKGRACPFRYLTAISVTMPSSLQTAKHLHELWSFRAVVPINQACLIRCLPNQTHLTPLISSLIKTPRPQMGAPDKSDIQDAQCRFGNHRFGTMETVSQGCETAAPCQPSPHR